MISALLRKLRYRANMRVAIFDAPAAFEAELARAPELVRLERGAKKVHLVQAFFTRHGQLERDFANLAASLAPRGVLWICHPRNDALSTDLDRELARALIVRCGWQVRATVIVDEVWIAHRCTPRPRKRLASRAS